MHSLRTTTGDELLNVIDAFASADLDSDGKLSSAKFHSWYTRSLRRHGHSLSDPDLIYKLRRVDAAVADGSGQRVVWTERAAAPEGATEARLEWHAASPSAISFPTLRYDRAHTLPSACWSIHRTTARMCRHPRARWTLRRGRPLR